MKHILILVTLFLSHNIFSMLGPIAMLGPKSTSDSSFDSQAADSFCSSDTYGEEFEKISIFKILNQRREALKEKNTFAHLPYDITNKYKYPFTKKETEQAEEPIDDEGNTLAHIGVKNNDGNFIGLLLHLGVGMSRNKYGISPLDSAIVLKRDTIFNLLIEKHHFKELPDGCLSPFHYAAMSDNCFALRKIFERKLEEKTLARFYLAHKDTPLFLAVTNGYFNIVKLLIENKCHHFEFDQRKNTKLLSWLFSFRQSKLIKPLIVDGDGNEDWPSRCDQIPLYEYGSSVPLLHASVICNLYSVATYLLNDLKAQVDYKGIISVNPGTPLLFACRYNRPKFVKLFLKKGAKVDYCNNQGYMPIHVAAEKKNFECLRLFIEHGLSLDIETKNEARRTCLGLLGEDNKIPFIRYCLKNGTDPKKIKTEDSKIKEFIDNFVPKRRKKEGKKGKKKKKKKTRSKGKEKVTKKTKSKKKSKRKIKKKIKKKNI